MKNSLQYLLKSEYNVKWPDQSQSKKRNIPNNYKSYNKLSDSSVEEYNE
ncbi:43174_t:CDS:1, partial [Gigaspora margarita]